MEKNYDNDPGRLGYFVMEKYGDVNVFYIPQKLCGESSGWHGVNVHIVKIEWDERVKHGSREHGNSSLSQMKS